VSNFFIFKEDFTMQKIKMSRGVTLTDVKIEYMDGTVVSGNYGYTTWHNIRSTASPEECVVFS
jgi:hypothetical protein